VRWHVAEPPAIREGSQIRDLARVSHPTSLVRQDIVKEMG